MVPMQTATIPVGMLCRAGMEMIIGKAVLDKDYDFKNYIDCNTKVFMCNMCTLSLEFMASVYI